MTMMNQTMLQLRANRDVAHFRIWILRKNITMTKKKSHFHETIYPPRVVSRVWRGKTRVKLRSGVRSTHLETKAAVHRKSHLSVLFPNGDHKTPGGQAQRKGPGFPCKDTDGDDTMLCASCLFPLPSYSYWTRVWRKLFFPC